jgi:tripartite-type tricarboxylate transporter receptor subunit TctC
MGGKAMKKWLTALAAIGCLVGAPNAQAQKPAWPSKTITIVVTAAAGGVTDVLARAIGQRLSKQWGQDVIIENKGGGGHVLGAQAVIHSTPDGYTLLLAEAGAYVINPLVFPKERVPYDVDKDLIPITNTVRIYHALLASNKLPVKTFAEFIALAKAKPGTITYGTAGIGSGPHMNMALLENIAGIKMVAVHYRGATPSLNDVVGGHTDSMLISVSSGLGPLHAGKLKMLAIGSEKRLPTLPDIPTASETVPGYTAGTWFGLSAPTGTPHDVIMKINAGVRAVLDDPEFRKNFLEPRLFFPVASSPEDFVKFLHTERTQWAKVIKEQHLEIRHK